MKKLPAFRPDLRKRAPRDIMPAGYSIFPIFSIAGFALAVPPHPGYLCAMAELNIGFVVYGSPDQLSGGYRYDRELAAALRERGHRVQFIDLPRGGSVSGQLPAADTFDLLLLDELIHPDLYNQIETLPVPALGVVHHLAADENIGHLARIKHRRMERRFLLGLTGSIFNTEATRRSAQRLAGRELPGFVALPGREEEPPPLGAGSFAGSPVLLSVGNLIPRKGIDRVLRALRSIERTRGLPEGFVYRIVGDMSVDPEFTASLKRLSQGSELAGRVVFTGRLDDEELRREYAAADIFCLPSDHEGFGIVYLEAMGAGCAVVASASGGAAELISHGRNGFLTDPRSRKDLKGILTRLLTERELRQRLGSRAREEWQAFPSWRMSMLSAAEAVEELISSGFSV
jgi:glycosyltransferase involved in cell wall biosynthesis